MATEEVDVKPFEYGFPQLHLLTTSENGLGLSQPLQIDSHNQGLLNFAKLQVKDYLNRKNDNLLQHKLSGAGIKRKHNGIPKEMKLAITNVRSVSYKDLLTQTPRKPRTTLTADVKQEIVDFHKEHPLLRQGEIADIFGIDRTTVTKLLKRRRHEKLVKQETVWLSGTSHQYELEDILYRWITRSCETIADWTDKRLLQKAVELQEDCDISLSQFRPTLPWLHEFKRKFRLNSFSSQENRGGEIEVEEPSTSYSRDMAHTQSAPEQEEPLDLKKNTKIKPVSMHKIPREKHKETESSITTTPKPEPDPKQKQVVAADQMQELTSEQGLNKEMQSMEKFREQQKAMEEANKQKKALLSKTITERKKRAQKEAYKLEQIQKELSKLDSLLTADVQVIRGKIEEASRDFLDAQKRFEKAEVEYIAAKLELHNKSEMKEQLTEHLYTIIHQNEVRKAKKLAELMKELEMEASEEDVQLPELPPLTAFQPSTLPQQPHSLSPTGPKSPHPQEEKSQSIENNSQHIQTECVRKVCPTTNTLMDDPEGAPVDGGNKSNNCEQSDQSKKSKSEQEDSTSAPTSTENVEPLHNMKASESTSVNKMSKESHAMNPVSVSESAKESDSVSSDANGISKQVTLENLLNEGKTKTAWDFDESLR